MLEVKPRPRCFLLLTSIWTGRVPSFVYVVPLVGSFHSGLLSATLGRPSMPGIHASDPCDHLTHPASHHLFCGLPSDGLGMTNPVKETSVASFLIGGP